MNTFIGLLIALAAISALARIDSTLERIAISQERQAYIEQKRVVGEVCGSGQMGTVDFSDPTKAIKCWESEEKNEKD
jgi:hypothetical protein